MLTTKRNEHTNEALATPEDASSNGQYLPVHDKAAELDTIFKDASVKHGFTLVDDMAMSPSCRPLLRTARSSSAASHGSAGFLRGSRPTEKT
jgi:hypothetical protein